MSLALCRVRLQLLIGFESGTIVQWDLRAKKADFRIYYDEVSSIVCVTPSMFTFKSTDMTVAGQSGRYKCMVHIHIFPPHWRKTAVMTVCLAVMIPFPTAPITALLSGAGFSL